MAGFFKKAASYGLLGGAPGAYASNKKFRTGVNDFLFKPREPSKLTTLDENQQSLWDEYNKSVMGQGGMFEDAFGYDQEGMQDYYNQAFVQPAMQQFQQETVPGITGAFRGKNLQNSSYLGGALANAGTKVQQDLNGKLQEMLYKGQQSAMDRKMDAVRNIMGTQTFAYQKPQQSLFETLLYGMIEHGPQWMAAMA